MVYLQWQLLLCNLNGKLNVWTNPTASLGQPIRLAHFKIYRNEKI